MKLYIKQKAFSIGDKFFVYDENGIERYLVEEELLFFGKKLCIYTPDGEELANVEKTSFFSRYAVSKAMNRWLK